MTKTIFCSQKIKFVALTDKKTHHQLDLKVLDSMKLAVKPRSLARFDSLSPPLCTCLGAGFLTLGMWTVGS